MNEQCVYDKMLSYLYTSLAGFHGLLSPMNARLAKRCILFSFSFGLFFYSQHKHKQYQWLLDSIVRWKFEYSLNRAFSSSPSSFTDPLCDTIIYLSVHFHVYQYVPVREKRRHSCLSCQGDQSLTEREGEMKLTFISFFALAINVFTHDTLAAMLCVVNRFCDSKHEHLCNILSGLWTKNYAISLRNDSYEGEYLRLAHHLLVK